MTFFRDSPKVGRSLWSVRGAPHVSRTQLTDTVVERRASCWSSLSCTERLLRDRATGQTVLVQCHHRCCSRQHAMVVVIVCLAAALMLGPPALAAGGVTREHGKTSFSQARELVYPGQAGLVTADQHHLLDSPRENTRWPRTTAVYSQAAYEFPSAVARLGKFHSRTSSRSRDMFPMNTIRDCQTRSLSSQPCSGAHGQTEQDQLHGSSRMPWSLCSLRPVSSATPISSGRSRAPVYPGLHAELVSANSNPAPSR